ncbi:hypothetical protein PGT21_014053 [Puccinia graminis f. sp. tritici]|uniref:Uncharacterized protein n=1 Tax=Puccinia graminis f. sp. tritici TaxID=56615 RepID=A0A5B0NDY3_PUCGR|nr:hypothetical protein PGT21_014053 [Puccinia graminis f. sp. tritici]
MSPQGFSSRKVRFSMFLRPLCRIINPLEAKQGYPWAFGQKRNGGHLDPISCLGLIKHAGHPGRNISTQLSVISNNFRYRDASAAGHESQGAFS